MFGIQQQIPIFMRVIIRRNAVPVSCAKAVLSVGHTQLISVSWSSDLFPPGSAISHSGLHFSYQTSWRV